MPEWQSFFLLGIRTQIEYNFVYVGIKTYDDNFIHNLYLEESNLNIMFNFFTLFYGIFTKFSNNTK